MINIHGSSQTVVESINGSLLDSLDANSVHVESHCRSGFCGVCRTKLVKGKVNYITEPLAFKDDDEVLPCCCKPVSDITIQLL